MRPVSLSQAFLKPKSRQWQITSKILSKKLRDLAQAVTRINSVKGKEKAVFISMTELPSAPV